MKYKLALSAIALIAAQSASASTLDIMYNGPAAGYRVVDIDSTSVDVVGSGTSVYAGGFEMSDSSANGLGDFVAWCLDLAAWLGTSGSHEYKTTETPFQNGGASLMSGGLARVASVFNANFGASITATADASAAFQLALWESVYDTDMNITSGTFKATSTAQVEALATGYLNMADSYTGPETWKLTYLESTSTNPRRQNLVTAEFIDQNEPEPVPLPATGLLLLAGLGGLAAARRRAKS